MITFRCAAGSDVGLERSANEDSAYFSRRLLAVADGMGGHAGGDVASTIVIECLARMARAYTRIMYSHLQEAVQEVNRKLSAARRSLGLPGMGSTLTALAVDGKQIVLAHIGDSRAYAYRKGALVQLTIDHTYVQRLIEDGQITAAQAAAHPDQAALLRVLNGKKMARADVAVHAVGVGDRFLLCSDGLHSVVHHAEIERAMTLPSPETAVARLLKLAREGGAPDNVTCIVADAVDAGRPDFPDPTAATLGAAAARRVSV